MILRCTQGHSAPLKPLVIWSKFSSSLIPRVTVPALLLPYFHLLCPQNKHMQRRQDFESTHRGLCKCNNISFCSKIKTDMKISHQLTGPVGIVRRPLGTYLDDITWMKPLCIQSTPVTKRSLPKCWHSVKFRQLCWLLPSLLWTLCQGWKAQPLWSSLSGGATQSLLSKFFLRMLRESWVQISATWRTSQRPPILSQS